MAFLDPKGKLSVALYLDNAQILQVRKQSQLIIFRKGKLLPTSPVLHFTDEVVSCELVTDDVVNFEPSNFACGRHKQKAHIECGGCAHGHSAAMFGLLS